MQLGSSPVLMIGDIISLANSNISLSQTNFSLYLNGLKGNLSLYLNCLKCSISLNGLNSHFNPSGLSSSFSLRNLGIVSLIAAC